MRAISLLLACTTLIAVSAPAMAQQPAPPAQAPAAAPAAPAPPPGWGSPPPYAAPYGAPYAQPYGAPPVFSPWPQAPVEPRGRALRTTGIILWALGGATTAAGVIALFATVPFACVVATAADAPAASPASASSTGRERIGVAQQALSRCDRAVAGSISAIAAGQVAALAAIPIFVIGARRDASPASARAVPEVRVSATSAELRWAF